MTHPEILLVPILMLADYFLTVCGAGLAERGYRKRFQVEHYELNPLWQRDIAKRKLINVRHLLAVLLATSCFLLLAETALIDEALLSALLGFVLVLNAFILGRHLSNLLTFHHVLKSPDHVSGQVVLAHPFVLSLALYQSLAVTFPLVLIAIFSPSPFVFGGLGSIITLSVLQLWWLRQASGRTANQSDQAGDKVQM